MNKEERKCLNDCGFANVTQLLLAYVSLQQENQLLKRNCNIVNENLKFYKQENQQLKDRINKAIEITHRILMNNADNRMICDEEEKEYFDWLDRKMLEQEKILKEDNKEKDNGR